MAKLDQEILKIELDEIFTSGMITSTAILSVLGYLGGYLGEDFTIERACEALDQLASDASATKERLIAAKKNASSNS